MDCTSRDPTSHLITHLVVYIIARCSSLNTTTFFFLSVPHLTDALSSCRSIHVSISPASACRTRHVLRKSNNGLHSASHEDGKKTNAEFNFSLSVRRSALIPRRACMSNFTLSSIAMLNLWRRWASSTPPYWKSIHGLRLHSVYAISWIAEHSRSSRHQWHVWAEAS